MSLSYKIMVNFLGFGFIYCAIKRMHGLCYNNIKCPFSLSVTLVGNHFSYWYIPVMVYKELEKRISHEIRRNFQTWMSICVILYSPILVTLLKQFSKISSISIGEKVIFFYFHFFTLSMFPYRCIRVLHLCCNITFHFNFKCMHIVSIL